MATPAGGTGQGGIDRIMASLQAELRAHPHGVAARFAATRGSGSLAFSPLHLARFCSLMAAGKAAGQLDLVHINLSSRGSTYRKILVAAWARSLGLPYVVHLHGSQFRSFWSESAPILRRSIRALFGKASRVVVLGSPWLAFVAEQVPEARDRIVVVPNAVERPHLKHVGGGAEVHILFMGRIGERKGVPELVRALARLRDLPGWRATLAGDGAAEVLRAEVKALGMSDRVSVPGWLGPQDAARLLAAGDVLALPSYAENLPMSVIEAMAAGLGVVATPVGAVEDIIKNGETGLLVPVGDDAALGEALFRLISDTPLRLRLSAAGQAFQRQHLSIEPYAGRMASVWRDAVAVHRGEACVPSGAAPYGGT